MLLCGSLSAIAQTPHNVPWAEKTSAIGRAAALPGGILDEDQLATLADTGEQLFSARFTQIDGARKHNATGSLIATAATAPAERSFEAASGAGASACASCHNEPLIGGAGDIVSNIFIRNEFTDSTATPLLHRANERGTNHLFGAGLIELLAREMSADLARIRQRALTRARNSRGTVRLQLISKGVSFGHLVASADGLINVSAVVGVDSDLIVRPFSQQGDVVSLRQFTLNALDHHHGMQAQERFGARWTGTFDQDGDGRHNELAAADVSALVAWLATLEPPFTPPAPDLQWQRAAESGSQQFDAMGCVDCHRRQLPLTSVLFSDPGPYDLAPAESTAAAAIYDLSLRDWLEELPRNNAGDVMVPLFGDLKRHRMHDTSPARHLPTTFQHSAAFMTAELWGVAATAPYGHRNDFTTLDAVIRAHAGDAAAAADAYRRASDQQRSSLIAFLKTLGFDL